MLRSDSRAWIASVSGVDAALSMANAGESRVFAMFVPPDFEGQGLGRALMQEAEEWLCGEGRDDIRLLAAGNPAIRAHGFYQCVGWKSEGMQTAGQIRYVKRCREIALRG